MAAPHKSELATVTREHHGAVFIALARILEPYKNQLAVKTDRPGNCYLETHAASLNGRRLFFGGAKIKKNYVSFYLAPLYMFPDLLQQISPALRKLMQGQSCFNFTKVDQECFNELDGLTQAAFQRLKTEELL